MLTNLATSQKESMTLDKTKADLKTQQQAFKETATRPNTLERNLVLAGHRNEIGRLEKVIASTQKLAQAPVKAVKPRKRPTSE